MQAHQLISFIEEYPSLKNNFDGVFAIDMLPKKLKLRHFIICNTDISNGPGQHWFVILHLKKQSFEVFDSLGLNETKKEQLIKNCKFNVPYLNYNKTAVQDSTSNSCGLFCLYFLVKRLHNLDLSFKTLLNLIFTDDYLENELNIKTFLSEMNNGENESSGITSGSF